MAKALENKYLTDEEVRNDHHSYYNIIFTFIITLENERSITE